MPSTTRIALKLETPAPLLSILVIPAMAHISIEMATGLAASRSSRGRKPWPLRAKVTVGVLALVLVAVVSSAPDNNPEPRAANVSVPPSSSTTSTMSLPAPAVVTSTLAGATTSETTTPPTTTAPPTAVGPVDLAALQINDSPSSTAGYHRDLFPTWLDLDGNGCDARDDTLTAESLVPVERNGCDVISGRWLSIYDEVTVTEAGKLDVDHMVPLAEAWRSGASNWDAQRRARYANDLTYPDHLIAVTASTNRSKGDRPPDEWRPPNKSSWCRYASAWVQIKETWALTATSRERDALGQMLATC